MQTIILAPGSLSHVANIVKGYAIAVGIIVAIGFVWMWWIHRQRERSQEWAVRATAVWGNWLRFAVDHPDLADPSFGRPELPADVARYRAFVATLLVTAEEVLLLADEPRWRDIILRQLEPHRAYLASDHFRTTALKSCSLTVRELMTPLTGVA